jgi:hypothetical protein
MVFPLRNILGVTSLLALMALDACGTSANSPVVSASSTRMASGSSNIEAENKGIDPAWFNVGYYVGPGHRASGISKAGG